MKAKVTHPEGFNIFDRGQTYYYPQGTILTGDLAEKAVNARRASRMVPQKKRSTKNAGAAPENKAD